LPTEATVQPVSDRLTRERVFELVCKRQDGKDALAQMVLTLHGIIKKGFIGRIELNCNGSGNVSSIKVTETSKCSSESQDGSPSLLVTGV
jgi:hypothetical protein